MATAALAGMAAVAATVFASATPAAAIVGGYEVNPSSYPYFAKLLVDLDGTQGRCGATVIDPEWVLTAAHCVTDIGTGAFFTTVSCVNNVCGGIPAQQEIVDPLWDRHAGDGHDLALLHYAPGELSGVPSVPQVGAPWDSGAYAAGTPATIMGYGETSAGGQDSSGLRIGNTALVSDDQMDSEFNPSLIDDNWIEPLMIGAGSSTTTVCSGDSGGPLIVYRNGHAVEVGVASFMYTSVFDSGCDNPAGFAELSGPQLAWVASQVPSIIPGWGTCTASDGYPGQVLVNYGPTPVTGGQSDGPNYWRIACEVVAGVTVPNVLGMDQGSAQYYLSNRGLNVGSVSYHYDCASPGDVETQNPVAGTKVGYGSAVNITVSACSSDGGGSGGGGGTSGGGGRHPILPQ